MGICTIDAVRICDCSISIAGVPIANFEKTISVIFVFSFVTFALAETAGPKPTFKQKGEMTLTRVSNKFSELLGKLNVVGKFEKFGKTMAKQNGTVVENAANGVHTQMAKRTVSNIEKVRQSQQNLDKVAAEKIKKYDTVE